jgi:hypothetical protein
MRPARLAAQPHRLVMHPVKNLHYAASLTHGILFEHDVVLAASQSPDALVHAQVVDTP